MSSFIPVLNCDVDGVLYDFTGVMRREISAVMGIPSDDLPDPHEWRLHKAWPITYDQLHSIMYDGIAQGRVFRNGPVIDPDDGPAALQRLMDAGWHVRLVSAKTFRDPFITYMARRNMLEWLEMHEIPHHTISFSDSMGKQTYRADAIVDDKPTLEWAQWGADNFLFDHPWNQEVRTGSNDTLGGCLRVSSLAEVADLLLGVEDE